MLSEKLFLKKEYTKKNGERIGKIIKMRKSITDLDKVVNIGSLTNHDINKNIVVQKFSLGSNQKARYDTVDTMEDRN